MTNWWKGGVRQPDARQGKSGERMMHTVNDGSSSRAYGSRLNPELPSPTRQYLYVWCSAAPGTKPAQLPPPIGTRRLDSFGSQSLKSPQTCTSRAFGAQTRNVAPSAIRLAPGRVCSVTC